jgi:hypothetical protein
MTDKNKLLIYLRTAFIAGLAVIAVSVFVESFKVSALSTYKADLEKYNLDQNIKYKIEAPDKPLNESNYLIPPDAPKADAIDAEKEKYNKLKNEYEAKKEAFEADYKKAMAEYEIKYKEYQTRQRGMDISREKDYRKNEKAKRKIAETIRDYEIGVNSTIVSATLRFIGSLLFFIGSLGMLILGDNYEKVGVLFAIGFSVKTIIGL